MANDRRVLIIGQGLAGSTLALELSDRGWDVQVLDANHSGSSSCIAAGMWHPMNFRRMVLNWRSSEQIARLHAFHEKWQRELGEQWFYSMPLTRLFAGYEENNDWQAAAARETYKTMMQDADEPALRARDIRLPFGAGCLQAGNAGYVNLPLFMDSVRMWLQEAGRYRSGRWRPELTQPGETGVVYDGETYDYLIFCQGWQQQGHPWFGYLPVLATKGQVLTVHRDKDWPNAILNRGSFILPLNKHEARLGATFEWRQKDLEITSAAREELLAGADKITDSGALKVVAQVAGFRPTVPDRRPMIGWHPRWSRMGVFNGLGSRGVIMAPDLAYMIGEVLAGNAEIWPEVDIQRFAKFYEKD